MRAIRPTMLCLLLLATAVAGGEDHSGASKDFIVHRIANGAGVPGFENVTHLDALPEGGAWVVALPMKISGGSGGPLRIVALLPR